MRVEIISIGDELLIGQTINTNAAWMGEQLNLIGLSVMRGVTIADTREAILESLEEAEKRADIVLMTGGLGPTKDDITKHALCEYFGSKLVMNQPVLERISGYFASVGRPMLAVNTDQAMLPDNCTVLDNMLGTASGMWFERNDTIFVSMPGVPYEMKGLMTDQVFQRLIERFAGGGIVHRTIQTQGIGESYLAERMADWEESLVAEDIKIAYLPSPGQVRVRLSAFGENEVLLREKVERKAKELEDRLPQYVFGEGTDTLEVVLGRMLTERNESVSTAESCTGGYLAHLITGVSGSSAYYPGSVVSYSNEIKEDKLGVERSALVSDGAVSEIVVRQMAEGVRSRFRTTYGVSTSGVAGPTGGSEEKPVGTVWIAVAGPHGTFAKKFQFGNHRMRNIRKSALTAMNLLRLMIQDPNLLS